MTNQEKSDLQWKVRYYLGEGKPNSEIIERLEKLGFQKATIKKYINAFSEPEPKAKPVMYDARIKFQDTWRTVHGLKGPPKKIKEQYKKKEIKWIKASAWQ